MSLMPDFLSERSITLARSRAPGRAARRSVDSTHGDLAAELAVHEAQLEPDVAAADHDAGARGMLLRARARSVEDQTLLARRRRSPGSRSAPSPWRARCRRTSIVFSPPAVAHLDRARVVGCAPCPSATARPCGSSSRPPTPPVSLLDDLARFHCDEARERRASRPRRVMPIALASRDRARAARPAAIIAFEGMQPTFRHVPPR